MDNRSDILEPAGKLRGSLRSPWTVGAVVLLLYGLWLFSVFHSGYQPRDFIHISPGFIDKSHASSVIKRDPNYYIYDANGYDGQFFYYLALDPVNARYYMDASTYRYTRILYPMVARAFALGQPDRVPVALIVINWFTLAGGTLAVAAWLKRRRVSPWFALVFGLYPGLQFALARDLSEILAYGLVAAAVLAFDFAGRYRIPLAAGIFALAGLARESTVLFAVFYAATLLWKGAPTLPSPASGGGKLNAAATTTSHASWGGKLNAGAPARTEGRTAQWRTALVFLAIAVLPIAVYKIFLLAWLGPQHDAGIPFAPLPFQGIWHWRYWETAPLQEQIRSVVVPGLIAGVVAALALIKRVRRVEVWLLLANVVLFVVFLQAPSYADYSASGRVTAGVVLGAILCLPWIGRPNERSWFWVSAALWLSLTLFWLIFPTMHYYLHVLRA